MLETGGHFTSRSSIAVVTRGPFVPHYPSLDQHVLKQVAEERREQLIEGTLIDVGWEGNLPAQRMEDWSNSGQKM